MKNALWVWPVWIAITSGIYGGLYFLTPLADYGIMWMSFISLPIFFTAGAKLKELPHYIGSMICGLLWGLANIWFTNVLIDAGLSVPLANFINLTLLTLPLVWLHFITLAKLWFCKVPMVFGALALTFSTGGTNLVPVGITLTAGLCLGVVFASGGAYFQKKFSKEKTEANV